MRQRTLAEVVISPNTITMPVLVAVSQATCVVNERELWRLG
jgi:hypothetical protein